MKNKYTNYTKKYNNMKKFKNKNKEINKINSEIIIENATRYIDSISNIPTCNNIPIPSWHR